MMEQNTDNDYVQVVSFSILNSNGKKEDYAIPIEQVREIRTVEKITKVPRSEPHVKGIMNLRGLIIPVMDVKEKLGLGTSEQNHAKQKILVAEVKSSLIGLLVDEVDQVLRLQTKDIETAPPVAFESYQYVMGIAKLGEKLMILLDIESLLGGSKEKSEKQSIETTKLLEKSTKKPIQEKPQIENAKANEQNSSDDIPPELAQVFKEDAEGIPPAEIFREAKTISEL